MSAVAYIPDIDSSPQGTLFSEAGGPWVTMPDWVRAFIEFGYRWPLDSGRQRLCFVSTPCDSPAAGLIALGAMIRRMEDENADDLGSHYGRLLRESIRRPTELVLRHRSRRGRFRVELRADNEPWLCEIGKIDPHKFRLLPANAADWSPENEPPVEAFHGGTALANARLYGAILSTHAQVREQNVSRSDSSIVLAGRATGKEATRRFLDELIFAFDSDAATLAELLSVHGWDALTVSRIRYLNPRGVSAKTPASVFDRPGAPPQLVIADGAAAFTVAYNNEECMQLPADIVTVIARTNERDELESFATELEGLRQWFENEQALQFVKTPLVPGVVVGTLVERT